MKARKTYHIQKISSSPAAAKKKSKQNSVERKKKGLPLVLKLIMALIVLAIAYIMYEAYVYYKHKHNTAEKVNNIKTHTSMDLKKTESQKRNKTKTSLYPAASAGADKNDKNTKVNNIKIADNSQNTKDPESKTDTVNKTNNNLSVKKDMKNGVAESDINKTSIPSQAKKSIKYTEKTQCTVLKTQNDVIYYENKGGQIIPCWKDFNWNGKGITVLKGQSFYPKTVTDKYVLIDDKHNIWLPKSYFNCKTVKVKVSDGN